MLSGNDERWRDHSSKCRYTRPREMLTRIGISLCVSRSSSRLVESFSIKRTGRRDPVR